MASICHEEPPQNSNEQNSSPPTTSNPVAVPLEEEIYELDDDFERQSKADEISTKIKRGEIQAENLGDLNLDQDTLWMIVKSFSSDAISIGKRLKAAKSPKAADKELLLSIQLNLNSIIEIVHTASKKAEEVPSRGNLLTPPVPDTITYNLAKENKKLKKRVGSLEWKYKDYGEIRMGKKNKNGSICQVFHRPILSECCSGFLKKPDDLPEDENKKILDCLNSSNNIITSNKKGFIDVESTCRCKGSDQNCALKVAKQRLEIDGCCNELTIKKKRLPSIRIISTNTANDFQSTWANIKNNIQGYDLHDEPKIVTEFIHKSNRARSFIVQVDPDTRLALTGKNIITKEDRSKIYLRDSIHVLYCSFCKKYGHSLTRCRSKPEEHVPSSEPLKCQKCTNEEHSPFDLKCVQRYRYICNRIAGINYGEHVYPLLSLWQ